MNTKNIELTIEDNIAYVTLNRPDKHNALDMDMFLVIDKTIKSISNNRNIRAVIVAGNGESFCSGLDVKSVLKSPKKAIKLLFKWLPGNANLAQRVSIGWRRLNIPVIMVMHGKCWGGGMQIALGGDYRIASSNSSLSVMEAKWGLIPDMGGTIALKENMTLANAKRIAITAEQLTAQQALEMGLITQVSENPMEDARVLAKQLCERSPDVNKSVKRMYQQIWGGSERKILAKETIGQIKILLGKNQKIAVKKALGDVEAKYRL